MHRVIIERERDVKIAREETFSSNIDRECVRRSLALFSDLFLPLKCSDLGPKLVYTYFRFYKGPPLKKISFSSDLGTSRNILIVFTPSK